MMQRFSGYSPRERENGERKPISGAQRRRLRAGKSIGRETNGIRPAEAGHYGNFFIQLIETTIGALGLSTTVLSRNRPSRDTAYCGLFPITLVPVAR
jgi:hypothetical protein